MSARIAQACLLSPTQARHLTAAGNQNAARSVPASMHSVPRELSEAVRLLQAASTREQIEFVLESLAKPYVNRKILCASVGSTTEYWWQLLRGLGILLDSTTKMNHWLRFRTWWNYKLAIGQCSCLHQQAE
ncbi:MAG: hypothetical protein R3C53_03535 [Pirellulaceae bacterium]